MGRKLHWWMAAAIALIAAAGLAMPASAQKRGGILRISSPSSPASMSPLESPTFAIEIPMMGVFNNLIEFDQHKPLSRLDTIVPDLATKWSWNEDGTALTFRLRHGVKWHDGKPFTAADVKCSLDLRLGIAPQKLRLNFQKSGLYDLASVTTNGDYEVTFHLKQPEPDFPIVLAGGFFVITPCHVSPEQLRQHPIGTGPFKFVEFKPNQGIKVTRNPDYWKPGRPYLDGVEYTIIPDPATADLAFVSGKVDMTMPYSLTPPQFADIRHEVPNADCQLTPTDINRHLLVNRSKPPFNDTQLRKAMGLALDRQAFVTTLMQGHGEIGGVLQPPPEGQWGMPPDQVAELPGYGGDVHQRREEARAIMRKLGYGPDKPLNIKVTTRDIQDYQQPAVLLIDQLKHAYINGELEIVDTAQYFPKIIRNDFTVALNLNPGGPSPTLLSLFYACGASLNWDRYCDPQIDKLIEQQGEEKDATKRKAILWTIERKLATDFVRPVLFYGDGGTCMRPFVKGLTIKVDSLYNGWRMEDVWLDK